MYYIGRKGIKRISMLLRRKGRFAQFEWKSFVEKEKASKLLDVYNEVYPFKQEQKDIWPYSLESLVRDTEPYSMWVYQ